MQIIELPLGRCTQLAAWGLVAGVSLLVLAGPGAWPWRLGLSLSLAAAGAWMWRRYRHRRPTALVLHADGQLACLRGDKQNTTVRSVAVGVAHPMLLSARLELADGTRCDLFVPACAATPETHWRLRRAVLGLRAGVAGDVKAQVSGRRGT